MCSILGSAASVIAWIDRERGVYNVRPSGEKFSGRLVPSETPLQRLEYLYVPSDTDTRVS